MFECECSPSDRDDSPDVLRYVMSKSVTSKASNHYAQTKILGLWQGTLIILSACTLQLMVSAALYRPLETHVRIAQNRKKRNRVVDSAKPSDPAHQTHPTVQ